MIERAIVELITKLIDERIPPARELLSVEHAAHRVDASVGFLRKAIRDGRLPKVMLGRCVRVRVADVDALASAPAPRKRDDLAARRAKMLALAIGGGK